MSLPLLQQPERLKVRLKEVPSEPGCYLLRDASDRILDKDRFRQDLGGVVEAYGEVLKRVQGACPSPRSGK